MVREVVSGIQSGYNVNTCHDINRVRGGEKVGERFEEIYVRGVTHWYPESMVEFLPNGGGERRDKLGSSFLNPGIFLE